MIAFMAWQYIGIVHSANKPDSLAFSFLWLFMFSGFVFAYNLLDDEKFLEKIFVTIALGGGLAGSIGVGQIFLLRFGHLISPGLSTFFNPFWGSLDVFLTKIAVNRVLPQSIVQILPRHEPIQFVERASATFTNPLFFSCWLVMALPFAAYSFFYSKSKRKKLLFLICIVGIIGGIAASYSRAPYLAATVTVLVMIFFGWRQALQILAITPVFLLIFPSGVYARLLAILDLNDGSITTRADVWSACIETFKTKWLWGLGPGVGNTRNLLINQYGIFQPHAHSLFLQLYLEGGIIGGSLFLALIVWIFIDIIILYARSKQNRPLAVTFFASFTGFLVCGITDYVLYGPKILQFFMLFLGLVVAAKRIYAKNGSENVNYS